MQCVQGCDICQQHKYQTLAPAGLLPPLPIPHNFSSWLQTAVDPLSKYTHFTPVKHPFTSMSIAEYFVNEVIRIHGFSSVVVSDRVPLL